MLIPSVDSIDETTKSEIIEAMNNLNQKLPCEIVEQFDLDERKALDSLWLKVLGFKMDEAKTLLFNLYPKLKHLIENR
jgi:hypothetical protein